MQLKLEPCVPPPWAPNGHAQTILGHVLPSPLLPDKGKRIEIPLSDGDRLVGFVLEGSSGIVVYLFHGLSGSTDATYIHRTARIARAQGHSVVMVNHRGCGEGAGMAKKPYHSGRGEDISAAIEFGQTLFPRRRQLAIGFSLSGNALLLLLAGKRGSVLPDAAISVNAPIDLESTSSSLRMGLNRLYDLRFFGQLRKDVFIRHGKDQREYDVPWLSTIWDFDQAYTAPASGFKNRDDYYRSCSTWKLLSNIKTPTVILTAKDDPFVSCQFYEKATLSPAVHLHIEEYGGHMGYLAKSNSAFGFSRWLDYALNEAIRSLIHA